MAEHKGDALLLLENAVHSYDTIESVVCFFREDSAQNTYRIHLQHGSEWSKWKSL